MMLVAYNIRAKVLAKRVVPSLQRINMPHQHGFIKGRSIYGDIIATMIGIGYEKFPK